MTLFCEPNWLPGHRYICIRGVPPSFRRRVEVRVVGAVAVGRLGAHVVAAGAAAAVVVGLEVARRLVEPVAVREVVDHVVRRRTGSSSPRPGRLCACSVRSIGKSNVSDAPPSGLLSKSGALLSSWSMYAWTLLPCVVVNSGPAAPLVSCQPNGDVVLSAGLVDERPVGVVGALGREARARGSWTRR